MSAFHEQPGGSHYKNMGIQPIDFITANNMNWCEANAVKYICRHRLKGGREDIEKAIHYLRLLLEKEYGGEDLLESEPACDQEGYYDYYEDGYGPEYDEEQVYEYDLALSDVRLRYENESGVLISTPEGVCSPTWFFWGLHQDYPERFR